MDQGVIKAFRVDSCLVDGLVMWMNVIMHDDGLLHVEHQPDCQETDDEHDDHIEVLLQVTQDHGCYQVSNYLRTHIESPEVSEEKAFSSFCSTV